MNPAIRKRVIKSGLHKNQGSFDRSGLCLICGKLFKSNSCPHSCHDQEVAITAVRNEVLLK